MTVMRSLLFAATVLWLAAPAPASADAQYRWWGGGSVDAPWSWVCGAFEYRHRCNAELHPRNNRCGCIVR
jgi:hypothetical protein